METETLIVDIINIPTTLREAENNTLHRLLNAAGYHELFDQVSKHALMAELENDTERIAQWLSWREDNKSDAGWYFKQTLNNSYAIGYYSPTEDSIIVEIADSSKACAMFIKLVIEEARTQMMLNTEF
ncbi:hypothetical protein BH09BAC6_BH09BAC6_24060 [soil metagenome]|jgi:hypothetical protein